MFKPLKSPALILFAFLAGALVPAAAESVTATTPPSLTIHLSGINLAIAPPESKALEKLSSAPADYVPRFESFDLWPSEKGSPGPLNLSPVRSDQDNTLILGGLYRQLVRKSLKVTSNDGSRVFTEDNDFKVHPVWPQIANLSGRLGKPGSGQLRVTYQIALQRLDLVQSKDGKFSVKQGVSKMVCPALPEPDLGAVAIAGVYVAPWQRDEKYVVAPEDIFSIKAVTPSAPINPEAIVRFTARLRSGGLAKIAFMGDSVTLGAEASAWALNLWTEKNLSYASRVVVGLRKAFPGAEIEPVAAVQGGTTSKVASEFFAEKVLPQKPDLVLIAFGLNDASSSIGGKPRVSVSEYKEGIRGVIQKAREAGSEIMLVTPMQPSPFLKSGIAGRITAYRDALIALASEENTACADVYADWLRQAEQGVPPFSQLHNWVNHPGNHGHGVYASTILRFFGDSSSNGPRRALSAPK